MPRSRNPHIGIVLLLAFCMPAGTFAKDSIRKLPRHADDRSGGSSNQYYGEGRIAAPDVLAIAHLAMPAVAQDSATETTGIAARYVGDRGIENDPRVMFAENFEQRNLVLIGKRWETVRNREVMSLSNDVSTDSAGVQSLLMSQVADKGTGGDLYRRLGEGYDRLYTRMYVEFAKDCEPVHHFGTCVGGNNPSTPWPSVRAGQPTQGDKAFWVGIEPFGESWQWDYYTYWCDMRGSPPRGQWSFATRWKTSTANI